VTDDETARIEIEFTDYRSWQTGRPDDKGTTWTAPDGLIHWRVTTDGVLHELVFTKEEAKAVAEAMLPLMRPDDEES